VGGSPREEVVVVFGALEKNHSPRTWTVVALGS
jgi:hypothetical protein